MRDRARPLHRPRRRVRRASRRSALRTAPDDGPGVGASVGQRLRARVRLERLAVARRRVPTRGRRASRARRPRASRARLAASASADAPGLPTLSDASTWRLRFDLFSGKDPAATTPDRAVTVRAKFVVDEGYEPPQGRVEILDDPDGMFLEGGRHRWTLEEVRRRSEAKRSEAHPPDVRVYALLSLLLTLLSGSVLWTPTTGP